MTRKKKKGAVRPRTTHDWQNKTQVHELAQSVEEFGLSQQFTTEIPVAQIYPDVTRLTLAEEARQTSLHDQSTWGQESKLRKYPVSFVSVGLSNPLESRDGLHEDVDSTHISEEMTAKTPAVYLNSYIAVDGEQFTSSAGAEANDINDMTDTNIELFFVDASRNSTRSQIHKCQVPIPERTFSPDTSSSDEVIIFRGRNIPRKTISTVEKAMAIPLDQLMESNDGSLELANKPKPRYRINRSNSPNNEESALIADYIANICESGEIMGASFQQTYNQHDLGGTDFDWGNESTDMNHSVGEAHILEDIESDSDNNHSNGPALVNTAADFDVMDWGRPSLGRKGTRARLNISDCDPELEEKLQTVWRNDRLKKSQRKKQREELRALGLLGRKAECDNMRTKYPLGLDLNQLAKEFQKFLLSSDETLILPPMNKSARTIIHELANKFHIKSKSVGKAQQRRPTLHRTRRTVPYTKSRVDQAFMCIHRRFFPPLDSKDTKHGRVMFLRAANSAATGYHDGEIVGASAPELGSDNRGRAMLEKMGWSSGTALGTDDNKGILLPVMQTMKKTKAGLG